MRQIILDTETTGLEWKKGNRVVEIGAVELIERRPSGHNFHKYLRPDCEFEPGAQEVTGLTLEFLADKPAFEEIVEEFLDYVRGAEVIIHNASFDVGFLDSELARLGAQYGRFTDYCTVVDTLAMARERYPGQRNSLDALCKRLGVDNTHRHLHGGLLDAQILADVYIALTSGQEEIGFGSFDEGGGHAAPVVHAFDVSNVGLRARVTPTAGELEAHAKRLEKLRAKAGGPCLWDLIEAPPAPANAEAAAVA
ncbi:MULTISPECIES: DNA polymerase III subunit epsilon [Pseudoxanthomonas]|uniref:DNA polymerase III subunit epsilon n=1 Tax=Pseudoxanthomonas winnipegensis TaxID=2480810 RepID=A0AAW8GFC8_9GAMM|nr:MULTISPECIES: DNA polymerase III subunit epsilon [Pseudoxanthomonas]MDQ1119731.1 DNA polymerase-3 subunit epsilon [Pseudoxanthomonas winnipegensis]MDQ1132929.1 DNA polymerase-3 subunit epsilon [Pseudoxanthomonas winnipegensis]MDR6137066.1 DNA polymerase-3 subunit epsilon [Pseudoxanthomonas sp. SORGH_AS_0997]